MTSRVSRVDEWNNELPCKIDDAPQFLEEVVEMERLAPHEQELQLTAVQTTEMFRERYGGWDACLNALHELKAQLAARWEQDVLK